MNKYLGLTLFTIISVSIVIFCLFLVKKYAKEKAKNIIFFAVSLLTLLFHYLPMLFSACYGQVEIKATYYLPVYPCNVIMWQNLFLSIFILIKKHKNKFFLFIAIAQFLVGTICVFVGIAFNKNFLNTPTLLDYDIILGLLSHVSLFFCCLLLFTGQYIKVNGIKNMLSVIFEGIVFLLCGFYTNAVIHASGQSSLNSMFLEEPPFRNYPFLNTYVILILSYLIFFILLLLFEVIKKPKEGLLYRYITKNKKVKS